jgi:hypothetical protein
MNKHKKTKDYSNLSIDEILRYLNRTTVSFNLLKAVTQSVVSNKPISDVNKLEIYIKRYFDQFLPTFNELKEHSKYRNGRDTHPIGADSNSSIQISENFRYAERYLNIPDVFKDDTDKAYTSILLYLSKTYGFNGNRMAVESRTNSMGELLCLESIPLYVLHIKHRIFIIIEARLFGGMHSTIVVEIAKEKGAYASAVEYLCQYFKSATIYKRDKLLKMYQNKATPPCISNVTLIKHISPQYWSNKLLVTLELTFRDIK